MASEVSLMWLTAVAEFDTQSSDRVLFAYKRSRTAALRILHRSNGAPYDNAVGCGKDEAGIEYKYVASMDICLSEDKEWPD